MPQTRVDGFGRIVIPQRIRSRLGLRQGSVLEIGESDEGIVLRPERPEPPVKVSRGVLVFSGAATGDLEDAVRHHRDERLRSVGGRPIRAKR